MANDWSSFRLRVNIDAPPEKVYAAWATPAGLESWFLRRAAAEGAGGARAGHDLVQPGDRYTWRWYGYPDEVEQEGGERMRPFEPAPVDAFTGGDIVGQGSVKEKQQRLCAGVGKGEGKFAAAVHQKELPASEPIPPAVDRTVARAREHRQQSHAGFMFGQRIGGFRYPGEQEMVGEGQPAVGGEDSRRG